MAEFLISAILLAYLVILSIAIYCDDNLFSAAMLMGIYTLLCAAIFVAMDAVDVAFTEAAVGAGISTILILAALSLSNYHKEDHHNIKKNTLQTTVSLIITFALGILLAFGFHDIPAYGQQNVPAYQGVAQHYIHQSEHEIGVPNIVTSILASYRGYDTLGELTVIFVAGITVLMLLGYGLKQKTNNLPNTIELQKYIVLRVVSRMLMPYILLFALYVQFHGDYGPGGGFQAGVILASGIILHILFYGHKQTQKVIAPEITCYLMAIGVLIFAGTGIVTLLQGGNFLEYNVLNPNNPIQGQHWGILVIEFGVGLTVAAVMLSLFYSFSKQTKD